MLTRAIQPFRYGATYKSFTLATANTAVEIVAPAANVSGLIVWNAEAISFVNADGARCALIGYSSAPTNVITGDVLASTESVGTTQAGVYFCRTRILVPVFVSAGKGLYFIISVDESTCHRSVRYTLK